MRSVATVAILSLGLTVAHCGASAAEAPQTTEEARLEVATSPMSAGGASERPWLAYLTAFGSIATPVLVLILTAVGWRLRHRLERQAELEDQLRTDRIETYNRILEPFVILFTSDAAWKADPTYKNKDKLEVAQLMLLSVEYRKIASKMSLVASDGVVRAYNNLMQYFFQRDQTQANVAVSDIHAMMGLLASFLLEIRRSMGNPSTELDKWEMLEWFLTEARNMRQEAGK